ncbi:hypothetical protein MWU49_02205 [Alcanivorax sp. S6407]|uniref:hypothetical protein n=1 Tax=Alcanivorax sp. S6407 TaxID=2926424 RepID=UPI001FF3B869|nr:hypothetical protein [Alcanivorax sp. S6407]MCK0152503.1 hypothetical protein [Alcanivorax sp. S6407]
MSRVQSTIWMAALAVACVATPAQADNTQAEIRRLQDQIDSLKAEIAGEPARSLSLPRLAVFGKVSLDAIYDDRNAGLDELLIPSTLPMGNNEQQNFVLHGKNSQLGVRVGDKSGPHVVFAADLFGSIDSYELRVRDFYYKRGGFQAGYGYTKLLDGAAWPLTLDAQGPNSAIFARQAGLSWQGDNLFVAVEDPNSEVYDPQNLSSAAGRRPDLVVGWQQGHPFGHGRLGMVSREIGVEFANGDQEFAQAGGAVLSGTLNAAESLRLLASISAGKGFAHYYNDLSGFGDGGMDGYVFAGGLEALETTGGYLGAEWQVGQDWTLASVAGQIDIESDNRLPDDAMRRTRYGTVSLVYQHSPRLSYGAEASYGMRDNQAGQREEVPRVQLNFTYRFLHENRN